MFTKGFHVFCVVGVVAVGGGGGVKRLAEYKKRCLCPAYSHLAKVEISRVYPA